jgi:Family of unknown function (DUF6361)
MAHDDAQRRRMQEFIELYRERDTVDELGIGSIRDAFSNLLFPGTSVLHTRARYFLFIPWIYTELERQRVPSVQIAARARRDEIRLISALVVGGEGEGGGVIGVAARDQLKQLPSYAYWNGLEIHQIRLYSGSVDRYHRSLDAYYALLRDAPKPEGGEPPEGIGPNWDPALPPRPAGLLESVDFKLDGAEASYLRDRIRSTASGSLLDVLIGRARPARRVPFPWLHPDVAKLPRAPRLTLDFARVFSEVMHGASLLYNLMLAEEWPLPDRIEEYRAGLDGWTAEVSIPQGWSWEEFWAETFRGNQRISVATRRFIERWFELVSGETNLPRSTQARNLMVQRERMTKGGQARLVNRRALEIWGGASGTGKLTYRWPVVERIVNDIIEGARGLDGDART